MAHDELLAERFLQTGFTLPNGPLGGSIGVVNVDLVQPLEGALDGAHGGDCEVPVLFDPFFLVSEVQVADDLHLMTGRVNYLWDSI